MDEGFPGFTLRSARRCRRAADLANSRRAAEACVILHHHALLRNPSHVVQLAKRICDITRNLRVESAL